MATTKNFVGYEGLEAYHQEVISAFKQYGFSPNFMRTPAVPFDDLMFLLGRGFFCFPVEGVDSIDKLNSADRKLFLHTFNSSIITGQGLITGRFVFSVDGNGYTYKTGVLGYQRLFTWRENSTITDICYVNIHKDKYNDGLTLEFQGPSDDPAVVEIADGLHEIYYNFDFLTKRIGFILDRRSVFLFNMPAHVLSLSFSWQSNFGPSYAIIDLTRWISPTQRIVDFSKQSDRKFYRWGIAIPTDVVEITNDIPQNWGILMPDTDAMNVPAHQHALGNMAIDGSVTGSGTNTTLNLSFAQSSSYTSYPQESGE